MLLKYRNYLIKVKLTADSSKFNYCFQMPIFAQFSLQKESMDYQPSPISCTDSDSHALSSYQESSQEDQV